LDGLEREKGTWSWLESGFGSDADLDFLRQKGCKLGDVARSLQCWSQRTTSYALSPLISTAFALKALQRLVRSTDEQSMHRVVEIVATLMRQQPLMGGTERTLWHKPEADSSEDDECEEDECDDGSDDGFYIPWDGDISGYGEATHKVTTSFSLGKIELRLTAECHAEVSSGSFASWECGEIVVRRKIRYRRKQDPTLPPLACWRIRTADAACGDPSDTEFDFEAEKFAPQLAKAMGFEGLNSKSFLRLVACLLASPLRLCGPPHAYSFEDATSWEALWPSARLFL